MSVETPKVEENTPVVTKPTETIPTESAAPATTEATSTLPATESTTQTGEPVTTTETAQNEAIVTAVPATEGVLGYKGPGLLNKFRFVKHFFWFSEEPLNQEGVDAYVKNEKAEIAHPNAAWAQETGKGVLFYAKRAEDKVTPSGVLLLADAINVTKVGATDFSFKLGSHTHKFEAASSQERDSWVVAIEKIVEDSKDLKAEVTGRESYKKTIEGYSFSPIIAGTGSPIKNDNPKKSLDAGAATNTAAAEPAPKADTSSESSVDGSKKNKEAEKQAKKERSQSRKRASVFGIFGKKDEDKEAKEAKEAKKAEEAEKKAEKEHAKELKKAEAEHKKEEAKAEHDAIKAKEAAEAAAIAAAPAAVAASVEKKEKKHDDKPIEDATSPVTSPTEKKNKRASVFGGFFGGKNKVTSPSAEKTESEVAPEVPAKDDTPAVSETAPKIEEPIDTKPIDAAAVTAPVDAPESSHAITTAEDTKAVDTTPVADSTVSPKTEKKNFFASFIKKGDKKEETKEEKTNEEAVKEIAPVVAAEPTTEPAIATTEPTTETPIKDAEAPKEERPAREKRRTSLFGSLGTLKRKTDKSPEPTSAAASEDVKSPETKREKSPLPSKLGGLFRKPSRSAKTELSAAEGEKTETGAAVNGTKTDEATKVTGETDTPANATIVDPSSDSKIVGDVVPENLTSTVHDAVTVQPEATKTTA